MFLGGCLLHPLNSPAYDTQSQTREAGVGGKLAADLLRSRGTNCAVCFGMWMQAQSRVVDPFSNRSRTPVAQVFRFRIRDNVSQFCELSEENNRRHAVLLRQDRVDSRFVTGWLVRAPLIL